MECPRNRRIRLMTPTAFDDWRWVVCALLFLTIRSLRAFWYDAMMERAYDSFHVLRIAVVRSRFVRPNGGWRPRRSADAALHPLKIEPLRSGK